MDNIVEQLELQSDEKTTEAGPVTCLGMTFENDEARRAYFTEELRKKLPELRKMEGFPIGEDEDILALSDPPYYTVCPNPWIKNIIEHFSSTQSSDNTSIKDDCKPFTSDIAEGKRHPIYNGHMYHTKVPHRAIMRYILHYTNPGDIIFDGFSGSGMTGVAASLCSQREEVESLGYKIVGNKICLPDDEEHIISLLGPRKTVLNDLSPQATFISYHFNNPVDKIRFEKEAKLILSQLKNEYGWLFKTQDSNTSQIYDVDYYVWSDVFLCPNCSEEIIFIDSASDKETGKVNKRFNCSRCNTELSKSNLERAMETKFDEGIQQVKMVAKQIPVLVSYKVNGVRVTRDLNEYDRQLLDKIEQYPIHTWYPTDELPIGYNTNQPIRSHRFTHAHDFYTKRILIILSALHHYISNSKFYRQLMLLFTSQLINISKLNRYRPEVSFPYNPLNGTLYVASQVCESNVFEAYENKLNRLIQAFQVNGRHSVTSCGSLAEMEVPENSIDYIFTDPPFGANIMYSELSFLWESWLKVKTNNSQETIINKVREKTIHDYKQLMEKAFKNYYKALKPGKWITVEFSNSQASVWNAIREAMEKAGFIIANVAVLDKIQGSFKAVTTTTAVKQDLVISAYKPKNDFIARIKKEQSTEASAWSFTEQYLSQLPVFIGEKGLAELIVERTPRILFDRMVAYHVQNGYPVPISSADFQAGIEQRFPMRDGMAFLETQVAEYDKKRILAKEFTQMSLFVSDENSAIEWLRQQLLKKPQTRQDLHPNFMKEIQHIAKHEMLPELDVLLEQNFLKYDGDGEVPSQIHAYLSSDYKDLRNLPKNDPKLKEKAKDRWYVPDPNKQADLEKLREKSLLREFAHYVEELSGHKKKLKQFRTEAIRAGFKKAWSEKDYKTIVTVGERLPETILQEDDKLLMYYDNAQTRLGL
jgi:DNA modification methylase/predicted RNA-binding Zn-ribbon protein involved in translation (DUF1610 family)